MRFIVPISALTAVSGTTSSQAVSKQEYNAACDTISKQVAGPKAISYCKVNPISSTAVCHQLLHVDDEEGLAGFHYHTTADAGTEEKPVSCQYAVQFLRSLETNVATTEEIAAVVADDEVIIDEEAVVIEETTTTDEPVAIEESTTTVEPVAIDETVNEESVDASEDSVDASEDVAEDSVDASEDLASEDSVDASEDVASEDSVDASEDVASEDSVDASEDVASEDSVDASEDVASEDSVDASEDVASEDSVDALEETTTEEPVVLNTAVSSADLLRSAQGIDSLEVVVDSTTTDSVTFTAADEAKKSVTMRRVVKKQPTGMSARTGLLTTAAVIVASGLGAYTYIPGVSSFADPYLVAGSGFASAGRDAVAGAANAAYNNFSDLDVENVIATGVDYRKAVLKMLYDAASKIPAFDDMTYGGFDYFVNMAKASPQRVYDLIDYFKGLVTNVKVVA